MAPIPTSYVLLKFRFTLAGDSEEMLCTIGAETTATDTPGRISVANSAMDTWGDNILPLQGDNYQLQGVDAIFGDPSGDIPISSTDPVRTGGAAQPTLPQNTAVLVKKVSGLGGRRNRGRMYIPGVWEGSVGNTGALDAGGLAAWQTGLNNFLLGLESGTLLDRAVIFHSSAPLTPTVIEQLKVDTRVATQRRRLRP